MAGEYRFSFGPWNIHEGADPFGPTVRNSIAFAEKLKLYKQLGFDGVQFHDDDALPDMNDLNQNQVIATTVAKTKKLLKDEGLTIEFVAPCMWEDVRAASSADTLSDRKGDSFVRTSTRFGVFHEKDFAYSMFDRNLGNASRSILEVRTQYVHHGFTDSRFSANTLRVDRIESSYYSSDCLLDLDPWCFYSIWEKMDSLRFNFYSNKTICTKTTSDQFKRFSKVFRIMRECYIFLKGNSSKRQLKLPPGKRNSSDQSSQQINKATVQVSIKERRKTDPRNKIPYDRDLLLAYREGFAKAA